MANSTHQDQLLRNPLDAAMLQTVKTATLILWPVFILFAIIHPFVWAHDIAIRLSAVAVINVLIFLGLYLYLKYKTFTPHYAHYIGIGIAGLLILDFTYQISLIQEPMQTTNFMLVLVASGILFVTFRWLLLVITATLASWLAFVLTVGFDSEWVHYGFALFAVVVLSVIAHFVRVYNLKRFNKLNLELEQRVQRRTRELRHANQALQEEIEERRSAVKAREAQEEKFQKIFENANDGIAYLWGTGEVITVNRKMEEVSGYSREELVGHNLFSHGMFAFNGTSTIEPFILEQAQKHYTSNGNVHNPLQVLKLRNKQGDVVWVETNTTTMHENGNGHSGYLIHLRDITERKETQQRLQLQSAALKAAPLGILITDVNGVIRWANSATEQLTGYTTEELIGESTRLFKSGKHKSWFYEEMWQQILSGETWTGTIINTKKNGQCYPEELSITPVFDDNGDINSFIAIKQDISEKIEAQDALQESTAQFQQLFDQVHDGVFRSTRQDGLVLANSALASILDFETVDDLLASVVDPMEYLPQTIREDLYETLSEEGLVKNFETRIITNSGREIQVNLNVVKRVDHRTGKTIFEGIVQDITAEKNMKMQLNQAQKMEAVGQLATGVAHDFNNLLTVIKGYTQLLLAEINYDQDHEYYNNLVQVDTAAKRAESLTRQLLAFSRRQVLEPKILDINDIVRNLEKMLYRLIEENIDLDIRYGDELAKIKADSGQVEQVIINIIVNARDALPEGGQIIVQTDNVEIEELSEVAQSSVEPNDYVRIAVSDNGIGMDEKTKTKIFEPFFTTKAEGKGTGLGLATVYGNVRQAGGYIIVDSTPGTGTTFTVYFPAVDEHNESSINPAGKKRGFEGSETVLVVEDQIELRKVIVETLQLFGYNVLEAESSIDAIKIVTEHSSKIDLILTDVIMPEMNGIELSKQVVEQQPHINVLYMSGYTDDVIAEYKIIQEGAHFLQKPFTPMDLGTKVRAVLD